MATDLSKSSVEQVLDLIRQSNSLSTLQFNATDVDLLAATPLNQHVTGKNTSVVVQSKLNKRYTGSVDVYYDRLNMQGLSQYGELTIAVNSDSNEDDILIAINAAYGCNLSADDVTITGSELIDYDGELVTFTAKAISLAWIGELSLLVKWVQIGLDSILVNPSLSGLSWPILPGSLLEGIVSNLTTGPQRGGSKGGIINGLLYAHGGRNNSGGNAILSIYNIANNSWTSGAAGGITRQGHISEVVNGKLYSYGGLNDARISIYTPENNSWNHIATTGINSYLTLAASASVGNDIYIHGGGGNGNNILLSELWKYDVVGNTWQALASSPIPFKNHSIFHVNGKIYAFGGSAGQVNQYVSVAHLAEYDIASNTWKMLSDAPIARAEYGGDVVNDRIYIYGGTTDGSASGHYNALYAFTPYDGSWELIGTVGNNRRGSLVAAHDDGLLIYGGVLQNSNLTDIYRVT